MAAGFFLSSSIPACPSLISAPSSLPLSGNILSACLLLDIMYYMPGDRLIYSLYIYLVALNMIIWKIEECKAVKTPNAVPSIQWQLRSQDSFP